MDGRILPRLMVGLCLAPAKNVDHPAVDNDDGSDDRPVTDVKLLLDQSLSVLARKLRMVGIDTQVAGEIVKHSTPGMMISPTCGGRGCRQ